MDAMHKTTVSFRIDDDKRQALDHIAKSLDRDRSAVINEAIGTYLDMQAWQQRHIEQALAETRQPGARFVEAWTGDKQRADKRRRLRERIDQCPYCNTQGFLELPSRGAASPSVRHCPHDPAQIERLMAGKAAVADERRRVL